MRVVTEARSGREPGAAAAAAAGASPQLRQQTMGVAEPRCAKSEPNSNYSPLGGARDSRRRQQAEEGPGRQPTCAPLRRRDSRTDPTRRDETEAAD